MMTTKTTTSSLRKKSSIHPPVLDLVPVLARRPQPGVAHLASRAELQPPEAGVTRLTRTKARGRTTKTALCHLQDPPPDAPPAAFLAPKQLLHLPHLEPLVAVATVGHQSMARQPRPQRPAGAPEVAKTTLMTMLLGCKTSTQTMTSPAPPRARYAVVAQRAHPRLATATSPSSYLRRLRSSAWPPRATQEHPLAPRPATARKKSSHVAQHAAQSPRAKARHARCRRLGSREAGWRPSTTTTTTTMMMTSSTQTTTKAKTIDAALPRPRRAQAGSWADERLAACAAS